MKIRRAGLVVSVEILFLLAILVIASITAMYAVRQAILAEAVETANAIRAIDQSFSFPGNQVCGAWTAGSEAVDLCHQPPDAWEWDQWGRFHEVGPECDGECDFDRHGRHDRCSLHARPVRPRPTVINDADDCRRYRHDARDVRDVRDMTPWEGRHGPERHDEQRPRPTPLMPHAYPCD